VTVLVAITAAARGIWSPCGLSMVSAINPFSEKARGNRYWLTVTWFVAGSIVGGAVLGGLAAVGAVLWQVLAGQAVTALVPQTALTEVTVLTAVFAAACCLIALASDNPVFAFRLPNHPRQVNERWLGRYRRWVYAAGFGFQIGSGFSTYIMTAAVYLTAVLGALSGSPMFALLVGLVFGMVRGLAMLLSGRAKDPAALRDLHRRLDLLAPLSVRTVMLVEALAAAVFGYLAGGILGFGAVAVLLALGGLAERWPGRNHRDRIQADDVNFPLSTGAS
jgi:MFS family permease